MRTRLLGILGLIEAVLAALLLRVLLTQTVFPSEMGLTLAWCLPIAFGLHVFEEFGFPGGLGEWSRANRPQTASSMTTAHFYRVNAIGGAAAMGDALGAFDYAGGYSFLGIRGWLAVVAWITFNALFHIRGTVESRRYCPGVVTSVALYLPLAVVAALYFVRQGAVDLLSLGVSVLWGVGAYVVVVRLLRKRAAIETSKAQSSAAQK
jgi:hypothetical protein